MTVFTSRIRRAHLRRVAVRRNVLFVTGFVLFVLLLGRVGDMDARDRRVMREDHVRNVVAEISTSGTACARLKGQ